MRFGNDIDRWKVERDLNKIWFGSYKLHANIAKFSRFDGEALAGAGFNQVQNVQAITHEFRREEHISYAQAIARARQDRGNREPANIG